MLKRGFYNKKKETFKTGKLDITVMTIVFICFIIAFFFLSFKPLTIDGEIVRSEKYWYETGDDRIPAINYFAILGPMILFYEAFLLTLEGKKRGRYLPWNLYYQMLKYCIKMKLIEGKKETRDWLNNRK